MESFNELLKSVGISPSGVKLVRNTRKIGRRNVVWGYWNRGEIDIFEKYQRFQKRDRFKNAELIASFISNDERETVFVGVYEITGYADAEGGEICPITGNELTPERNVIYDLERTDILKTHVGSLKIDWGGGTRTWVQYAAKQDKTIIKM